jgi:energy-coupling factor transport system permease protein
LPTISVNLRETIAAQRLRGYEVTRTRNPVRRLRQLQPLVVPVTVGAFVDAENVADALDLRRFGTQRRTSVRTLRFDGSDHIIVGLFLTVAVAATATSLSGHSPGLWVW